MKKKFSLMIPLAMAALLIPISVTGKKEIPSEAEAKIKKALPEKALAKPMAKRKLLVFAVTNGFRHGSIPTGQAAMELMGEATGAYEAVVSDDLANFESDKIGEFDAICFLSTTQEVFLPHPKTLLKMSKDQQQAAQDRSDRLQKNLMDFVKGGKGFIGIHAATDTFYKFPEFGEMINGYFSGHPWGAGTPVSIKVEPGQEKHPVVAMLDGKNLEFKEEIYQLKDPYDSKKVHMLLRLDTERSPMDLKGIKRTDKDFGVAWIRNWGQGRVFYCSLGHNDHIYQNATVLEHYLAGIQWAMGDLKAPVNVAK